MFARGVVSLHIAHVPGQKNLASNSCVSITSKLIETKPLQVLYFGHLRKTGGWGNYLMLCDIRLAPPAPLCESQRTPRLCVSAPLFLPRTVDCGLLADYSFSPQLFCFPYMRKNRGVSSLWKMSARRHF